MTTRILAGLALLAALTPAFAQNRTAFAGERNAISYGYGIGQAPPPLKVGANVAAGTSVTVVVQFGQVALGDGTNLRPLATTAPVTIGIGSSAETVTPSSVTCTTPTVYNSCTIVVTTTNAHGIGEPITSGTFGLQEAINAAFSAGGGGVAIDASWRSSGGTEAIIAAAIPAYNVFIVDNRGPAKYYGIQPNTLTALATPATQTASTIVFASTPTGTWAASATYFCVTYVDILGGESPCSATYNQTPTVNYTLTVTSPIASTGAVGWRMYAGITSRELAYLLPITSSNCTLTTLEGVMPACAIGANGTWSTAYTTTTSLSPGAIGVTSTNNPVPQGHTTFAYQPSAVVPQIFQTMYGPFGTGAIATATATAVTPLGSFNLPTGYLNYIGRTVRLTGKIKLTAGASSTLSIKAGMAWAGGLTAGLPATVCNPVSGFVFATQPYTSVNFTCTMTTNAVGTTAIGSIQPESAFSAGYAAGTLIPQATETSNAAIASLGLFSQNTFTIWITPAVADDTTAQLLSLHVETLQ